MQPLGARARRRLGAASAGRHEQLAPTRDDDELGGRGATDPRAAPFALASTGTRA